MILSSKDIYQNIAKEILASPHSLHRKYGILDISHLPGDTARAKFDYAIEILDMLYFYYEVNNVFKKLGFKKEIDPSILYETITHVFQDKPFSDEQLTRYFQLKREFKHITDSMGNILDYEDYMISWEVEFNLLGLTYDEYKRAEDDLQDSLFDNYATSSYKMEIDQWSIDEFIARAKELLNPIKDRMTAKPV